MMSIVRTLVVFALQAAVCTQAIWSELDERRCMIYKLHSKHILNVHYQVLNMQDKIVSLDVRDIFTQDVLKKESKLKTEGMFTVSVPTTGDYEFCFDAKTETGEYAFRGGDQMITISLEIEEGNKQPEAAIDLGPVEARMQALLADARDLQADYDYMRTREEQHRDTNESTSSRVLWLSIISICLLSWIGAHQVYHMKAFFRKKKLI